jgi:hypothetical protein
VGLLGYVMTAVEGNIPDTSILDILDIETKDMSSFSVFLDLQSSFWMAEMARYLLRPQRWFSLFLAEYLRNHLVVIRSSTSTPLSTQQTALPHRLYASFHLPESVFETLEERMGREGAELTEGEESEDDPLGVYFTILARTAPHLTHIFLSTTKTVIDPEAWKKLVR